MAHSCQALPSSGRSCPSQMMRTHGRPLHQPLSFSSGPMTIPAALRKLIIKTAAAPLEVNPSIVPLAKQSAQAERTRHTRSRTSRVPRETKSRARPSRWRRQAACSASGGTEYAQTQDGSNRSILATKTRSAMDAGLRLHGLLDKGSDLLFTTYHVNPPCSFDDHSGWSHPATVGIPWSTRAKTTCQRHHRCGRSRSGPQTPRYVHRFHRSPRSAPPGL